MGKPSCHQIIFLLILGGAPAPGAPPPPPAYATGLVHIVWQSLVAIGLGGFDILPLNHLPQKNVGRRPLKFETAEV